MQDKIFSRDSGKHGNALLGNPEANIYSSAEQTKSNRSARLGFEPLASVRGTSDRLLDCVEMDFRDI